MAERIYKFDNLKVWCMILVVIAHTLINSYGNVGQEMIRFFCLCYTMPLFTFISGYLSKIDTPLKANVKRLLVPCVVFTIVNDIVQMIVNPTYQFNWRTPGFAMWYLWALFIFRVTLPYLIRIPHILLISIVATWIIGFVPVVGPNFSFSRIVCFLPYFLLGYMIAHDESLLSLRKGLLTASRWGGYFYV